MLSLVWRSWQSWKSAKAVAALVVIALTVGIGSATAIYNVVHGLLLKPLPYAHGERFVSVLGATLGDLKGMSALPLEDVLAYQQARSFDVFGWMRFVDFNLSAPGPPMHLQGVEVTPPLANNLGVTAEAGGWFRDASAPAAVISHALWQRLGANRAIVGQSITLSGRVYTVTGVMPPSFNLPLSGPYTEGQFDVWVPLDPAAKVGQKGQGNNFCYARLRPDVTLAAAQAEVKAMAAEIAKRDPVSHPRYTARVDDLQTLANKEIKPILLLLFAGAELLLLIACANVGGLLLARSVARARDTAVRVALGAGLRQLAWQYFLEGLVVALPGAILAMLFSAAVVRLLVSFAAQQSARVSNLAMDGRVYAFAIGTAVIASVLTSLAPLWQAARTLPNEVLTEGVRASAGARSRRLSRWLVAAEIALAFVLLAGSAVLVSELYRVTRVWPGFDPSRLLTFELTFSPDAIPGKSKAVDYEKRLVAALEAIPGVSGAGFVNQLPLAGCCMSTTIYQEGASARPSTGERVSFLLANPGYFRAIGIPLRRGRVLDERDVSESLLPVMVNQATASRYWPDRDPIGVYGHISSPKGDRFQVVGVVGDVRNNGLDSAVVPEIYLPAAIVPANPMQFVVRSSMAPKALVPQVRRAIQRVNPGQPIYNVRTMTAVVEESVMLKRVSSYVMMFFALAALLMATLGTYGVVSYSVRQRTVEMGTRMALGAVGRDLLKLVLGSGLKMAACGVAIGGAVSVAAVWLLVRELEIQQLGALPFVLSAAIVAVVALSSSFFPAWRATLVSPMVAIRNEPGAVWTSPRRAPAEDDPLPLDDSLMTEFIDAARRADSYPQALAAALNAIRGSTHARTAVLLECVSDDECRAQDGSAVTLPRKGLLLGRLRFHSMPLPISKGDLEVWRRWAAEYRPEHLPEIETLRRSGARLAVPLRTRKEILGVLLLGPPDGREQFSRAEKRLLRNCADQFALMLENARLTDRVVEQEKLRRDLALAAEVQKRLLPRQSLETEVASLAAVNIPARSVGGDYYDFLDLCSHRTGIALADVAGKGIAAALIMSVVQASLRVLSSQQDIALPDLAAKMNHFLYRSTGPNSYATFFCAQIDEQNREFRYVNAGHNNPYLLRAADGRIEELSTGGTIIGMFPKAAYQEGAVELRTGDVFMVFTDGVTEALNPQEEEFGEERLKQLLRDVACRPVEEMAAGILQNLKDWIQDAPQYDDLTFVLMKVK